MSLKTTNDKFFKDLNKVIQDYKEDAEEIIAWSAVTYYGLVASVPVVDTGRYRASHQLEFNPKTDSAPDGLTNAQYEAEQKKKENEVQSAKFKLQNATYYIANNTSYAEVIEAGRQGTKGSLKAPDGVYMHSYNKFKPLLKAKMAEFDKKRIR